jgi:hypothetical protein
MNNKPLVQSVTFNTHTGGVLEVSFNNYPETGPHLSVRHHRGSDSPNWLTAEQFKITGIGYRFQLLNDIAPRILGEIHSREEASKIADMIVAMVPKD